MFKYYSDQFDILSQTYCIALRDKSNIPKNSDNLKQTQRNIFTFLTKRPNDLLFFQRSEPKLLNKFYVINRTHREFHRFKTNLAGIFYVINHKRL